MEYDGYDEVVRAWIQGVYDSRGNDAKRTLKFCYDIEQDIHVLKLVEIGCWVKIIWGNGHNKLCVPQIKLKPT